MCHQNKMNKTLLKKSLKIIFAKILFNQPCLFENCFTLVNVTFVPVLSLLHIKYYLKHCTNKTNKKIIGTAPGRLKIYNTVLSNNYFCVIEICFSWPIQKLIFV